MMMPATMKQVVEKARFQELALEAIFRKHELQPNGSTETSQQIEGAFKATNHVEQEFEEKLKFDRPVVTKNSGNEERSDMDISGDHSLYLQETNGIASGDEDDVADKFHAIDERQPCNEDLDQRKKWEAEDLHNPTTTLSISLVVSLKGVDQLQVLAVVEMEPLKLNKQENNHRA